MSIEELLQSADRPRELTADELGRLQDRLRIDTEAVQHSEVVIVELEPAAPSSNSNRRGLAWLAVAALVLVVLGFVALNGGGSDADNLVTDQTQSSPLDQVCSVQLVQLTEALEAWQGVENWVLTTNGEPDVAELILDTLVALGGIEDLEIDATRTLRTLEAELGDRGQPAPGGSAAFDKREAATTTALGEIIAMLRVSEASDVCGLDRLEAAI